MCVYIYILKYLLDYIVELIIFNKVVFVQRVFHFKSIKLLIKKKSFLSLPLTKLNMGKNIFFSLK